jgi:hypothetical protein
LRFIVLASNTLRAIEDMGANEGTTYIFITVRVRAVLACTSFVRIYEIARSGGGVEESSCIAATGLRVRGIKNRDLGAPTRYFQLMHSAGSDAFNKVE